MTKQERKSKVLEEVADIGLGCLGFLFAVPVVALYYILAREPKVKTKPTIPRLTTRGKIRFLEKQLRNVEKAMYKRLDTHTAFTDSINVYSAFGGFLKCNVSDLNAKERQIKQQLTPLYQKVGEYEKINEGT